MNPTDQNRVSRAQEFARNAHAHIIATTVTGIKRPHILHIQEVADMVWISGGSLREGHFFIYSNTTL